MKHKISPSLLAANFANLAEDIEMINRSEADWLHLDIMDGVFVPNISFGFEFNTSNHSFQLFAGNFYYLNPQRNNLYNDSNPFGYTDKVTGEKVKGGQFRIGFNITRLWNY
jgi:hypothetical protein